MEDKPDYNAPVQEIISLIQTNLDPRVMLTEIATILGQHFQADICLIVAESHSTLISQIGFWNRENVTNETTKQLLLNPLIKTMVIEGQLIAIADLQNNCQSDQMNQLAELLPVKALLGMATQFGQDFNGLILLGTYQAHAWTQQEQELLKRCSQVVAIANSMAHQKADIADNINPSLPFSSGSRSLATDNLFKKWYQLTRQQLEQQRQLNELKDEIITTISHEAGTPLATMKLAIQMLCDRQEQLSLDSQQRYWNILKQEWQRLHDLINNIKTLQQLKSTEISIKRQQVNLSFIFNEIVQLFQKQWQEDKRKRLTLVTKGLVSTELTKVSDSTLTLYTDPQHFRSVLLELLTNAGKFATPETTVSIEVTQQQQEKQKNLVITISNIGLKIAPEEQKHIFDPFRRGQGMTDKAIPGTGLGLTLVKGLVELLGGRIEVESHPVGNLFPTSIKDHDIYLTSFIITLSQ